MLQAVTETAHDATNSGGADGKIVYGNAAVHRTVGYSSGGLHGKPLKTQSTLDQLESGNAGASVSVQFQPVEDDAGGTGLEAESEFVGANV